VAVTKAVILAAGEGSRMRPLTYTRPKVMLPLLNKPILEHLVVEMRQAGINQFFFVVGYKNEIIKDYFGDGAAWQANIQYLYQTQQLGTADALRAAERLIDEDFLLANGDVIIDHNDIVEAIAHRGNTLSVIELPDVTGMGVVEVDKERVVRLHEKVADPPSHLANAGLYVFTPAIFSAIAETGKSARGEYEITESIQKIIDRGELVKYHKIGHWRDLSYPWHLLITNEEMLRDLKSSFEGEIEPNVVIKGEVRIGKNTLVRSGSYIVGPVIIGRDSDIGPSCFIRAGTTVGDHCHIGAAVEIKNSIVMSGSKIPHLNYVGDSVIGANCNLGAGTKIANLRLDKGNIKVNGVDTKRRKLGAILGDGVETGINCSINTGTLIGNNAFIGPGVLAHGIILPNSKIFE
jgi:UDP-N-acetylglucosamine diphosphorylase/glucosamine-1-phosphate N-acetyltransferase